MTKDERRAKFFAEHPGYESAPRGVVSVCIHGMTRNMFNRWMELKGDAWMRKNHPEAYAYFTI